jgi:queuine/archaeosine tRNA-ribosyltransferase
MNKWILSFFCIVPFWTSAELLSSSEQNELSTINHEILALKKKLHHDHLLEMKEEVKGQGLLIGNWEAYSHELELIRQQKEEDDLIELQIKKLEERKAQLLNKEQQS